MLETVFARMEARLKDHAYLVGDRISLADIAWIPQYVVLSFVGFDFSPYPAIKAWDHRIGERSTYKTAVTDWLPKVPPWLMLPMMKVSSWWRRHLTQ